VSAHQATQQQDAAFAVETYPSIKAWEEARRSVIGSSDAAAIWGDVNAFGSPRSVYEDKVNGIRPDIDPDFAEWGHQVEPSIANFYAWKTGYKLVDPGAATIYRSTRWPWMGASLDRVILLPAAERGALECKSRCGGGARAWREEGEAAPLDVILQLTHIFAVTGWRRGVIGVALGGAPPSFIDVERDDELVEIHVEKCRAFWHEHILAGVPPAVDGHEATTEALRRRFQPSAGKVVQLGDEALAWHRKLERIKRLTDRLQALEDENRNRLREAIGDAESARLPGGGSYRMTPVKESTFTATRKAHVRMTFRKGA
jgi:putative phage-type endonuclease